MMSVDLRFCGRETELRTLIERWRIASDVDAPSPQLVVIKAERGVGKTRLALEFGRWLSRNVDAAGDEGYWPDAFETVGRNLDVNSDPRQCRFDRPIPYLWWGLRAGDKGAPNGVAGDAVATFDRFLAPHLVALSMRATMQRTGRSLAWVWARVARDVGASAIYLDAVLTVGTAVFDTIKILHGDTRSRGEDAAREAAEQRPIGRVDAILSDLQSVFDPAAPGFARTPAVVLLDDGQFAADDPGLLVLVDRLLDAAMRRRWPLMIVVTHWRAELSPAVTHDARSFTGILTRLGPHLGDDRFTEIDLGRDVDLSGALADKLPGLLPAQSAALLDRAGGNPRFLEQIVALARPKISWFVDRDPARALTADGLAALLAAALDIHSVVLKRLLDAPESVREAIAFASPQGVRFACSLAEDVAQAVIGGSCRDGLLQAEEPYSVLAGTAEWSVAAFAERLFHEVALDLREDLARIPGGGASLDAALRTVLAARLDDPGFDRNADADERATTLGIAANLFSPDAGGAGGNPSLALDALARLTMLERDRYAYEAALAAAIRFADLHRRAPDSAERVAAWPLYACAELLRSDGRVDDALAILRPLVQRHRQLADRLNTPESLRDLSVSLNNVGRAAATRGDHDAAAEAYRESLDVARQLADRLKTPESLRDLSVSLDNVGGAAATRGDHDAAAEAYRESLDVARQLADRLKTPESLRDLCVSLYLNAGNAAARGDQDAAMALLVEGEDMVEHLPEFLRAEAAGAFATLREALGTAASRG